MFSSPHIVTVLTARKMIWAGRVARVRWMYTWVL